MVRVTASSIDDDGNVQSLDREAVTLDHVEVPVNVYRTSHPPIFAGFQVEWVSGQDPETLATFDLNAGAGFGSRYATLSVKVPGHETIYEYIDITELLTHRVQAIIAEVLGGPEPEPEPEASICGARYDATGDGELDVCTEPPGHNKGGCEDDSDEIEMMDQHVAETEARRARGEPD